MPLTIQKRKNLKSKIEQEEEQHITFFFFFFNPNFMYALAAKDIKIPLLYTSNSLKSFFHFSP